MSLPKIHKIENLTDVATLVVIGGLGVAMLIGLVTASGSLS